MKRIGFIGLGVMGKPMARNLMRKGYSLVVHNRSREPVEILSAEGARAAWSPKEVAEQAEVVITMLPDSPDVEAVMLGADGVLEGARPGSIIIDMSSIAPSVTKRIAAEVARKGVRMLDAPVSGGEAAAVEGMLSIMVGGSEADFEECMDILKAMGSSVTRIGDIGAGNTAKLANQIIVAANIAALAEAMALAAKCGIDTRTMIAAIRGGLAGSRVMDTKAEPMLTQNFRPGFRINLHAKDLQNALRAGDETGTPLPLASLVLQMMQALRAQGYGDEDHSALLRVYQSLAHLT